MSKRALFEAIALDLVSIKPETLQTVEKLCEDVQVPVYQAAAQLVQQLPNDDIAEMDTHIKTLLCAALLTALDDNEKMPPDYQAAGQRITQNSTLPDDIEQALWRMSEKYIEFVLNEGFFATAHSEWPQLSNDEVDEILQIMADIYCKLNHLPKMHVIIYSDKEDLSNGWHHYFVDYDKHIIGMNAHYLNNFTDLEETLNTLTHELCAHGVLSALSQPTEAATSQAHQYLSSSS